MTEEQINVWLRHAYGADTGLRGHLSPFSHTPWMSSPDHGWSQPLTPAQVRAVEVWSACPAPAFQLRDFT